MSQVLSKYKATPANATKLTEEIEQVPMEAKNLEVLGKNEKKDNERVEIQAEGANDSTIGNEIDLNSDLDVNGEVSTEGKLEQEIE
jgi:hypothetical protein